MNTPVITEIRYDIRKIAAELEIGDVPNFEEEKAAIDVGAVMDDLFSDTEGLPEEMVARMKSFKQSLKDRHLEEQKLRIP
jgi:hypothetical protein